MASVSELAISYAMLILHDSNVPATRENILKVTKAAGLAVEPFMAGLFARLMDTLSLESLLSNVGSAPAAGSVAVAAAGAAAPAAESAPAAAAAPKPVEEEEEEDAGMDFDLFG